LRCEGEADAGRGLVAAMTAETRELIELLIRVMKFAIHHLEKMLQGRG
jgi:hypothetical protein